MDAQDVKFVMDTASSTAGLAARHSLKAQVAMAGAILRLLARKGLIEPQDATIFCNDIADPLSGLITQDGMGVAEPIISALRSYADDVLTLGEVGVPGFSFPPK